MTHWAVLLAAAAASALVGAGAAAGVPSRISLTPKRFAEVSSGVALIRTYGCGGKLLGSGSGFLIGDRILVTARHVVDPSDGPRSCGVRARLMGRWVDVQKWEWWYDSGDRKGRTVDLAILKLKSRVSGAHLFSIRAIPAKAGSNLAAIGHPLGNEVGVTQGRLLLRKRYSGVPIMFVKLLGAEGASGSAFVDNSGKVVGILQKGLGSEDVLGQHTAGVTAGLDLSAWWGSGKKDLCRAYPDGGIPMCSPPKPSKPKTPTTPTTPDPPASPPSSQPDTITDAFGDSGTAPDITSVVVAREAGWVRFTLRLAAPITSSTQRVVLHLDTTGDFKDEYTWYGYLSKYDFFVVRGGQSVSTNPVWMQTYQRGTELEVRLELAGIGSPAFVNFLVITQSWVAPGGQPVIVDYDEVPERENNQEIWLKWS